MNVELRHTGVTINQVGVVVDNPRFERIRTNGRSFEVAEFHVESENAPVAGRRVGGSVVVKCRVVGEKVSSVRRFVKCGSYVFVTGKLSHRVYVGVREGLLDMAVSDYVTLPTPSDTDKQGREASRKPAAAAAPSARSPLGGRVGRKNSASPKQDLRQYVNAPSRAQQIRKLNLR